MNKAKTRRKVFKTILALIVVIAGFAVAGKLHPPLVEASGYLQAVIECVSILFAALTLGGELAETQRLGEAEFIVSLNEKFSDNEACKAVFAYAVWEANAKKLEEEGASYDPEEYDRVKKIVDNKPPEPDQLAISGYLTFFESLYLLLDREVITWDVVNELLKYRFFAGVHSSFIQKQRLVRLPSNFKNIYYLERLWMEYNNNDPSQIAGFANRLESACGRAGKKDEYDRILAKMEGKKHLLADMKSHPSERAPR